MIKYFTCSFLLCSLLHFLEGNAQINTSELFDKSGIPNSTVYMDVKKAVEEKDKAYKLRLKHLPKDKSGFSKINLCFALQAVWFDSLAIDSIPLGFTKINGLMTFLIKGSPIKNFPTQLEGWYNLNYLQFYGTKLDSIPVNIGYLQHLRSLDMEKAAKDTLRIASEISYLKSLIEFRIENTLVDTIPRSIGNLQKLKKLQLNKCGLTRLPKTIGNLNVLEYLSLNDNSITQLPNAIGKLKNLEYLSLKGNKLTVIPEFIANCINLRYLDLSGNNFTWTEDSKQILQILLPHCRIVF